MSNIKRAVLLAVAVMVVSVTLVAVSDDSEGASSYTARVFIGDGTVAGTIELSGTGPDIEGILKDALSGRIIMNANGTVKSLDGTANTNSKSWYILQWRPPTGWVSVNANMDRAYLETGTSYYVYYSDITVDLSGKVIKYSTPSSFKPVSIGYFYIKFVTDSKANGYVNSVLTEEQRLRGFWIAGQGSNIAEAFIDACSTLRARGNSGFELDINDNPSNTLYGWLGSFMGLEDDDVGNGLWNNWSQFSWNSSTGKWEYNNWCLGYYDPGVYPYFSVVRQITADDSATSGVTATPSSIPSGLKNDSCTVRFVDGNGTVIKSQTVKYFASATAPANPSKNSTDGTQYIFTGWDRDFTQVVSDITITAQFTAVGGPTTPVEPGKPTVPVTGVGVKDSKSRMEVGSSYTFTASIAPSDATNRNVVWSSSNPSVATVSLSGVVKAVSEGEAEITVTTVDGAFKDTRTVTVVKPGTPMSIMLDCNYWMTSVDKARVLTYEFDLGAKGTVTWSSDDKGVVTVDGNGKLVTVGEGEATVTAKVDGTNLSASCMVRVVSEQGSAVEFEAVDNEDGWQGTIVDDSDGAVPEYTMTIESVGSVKITASVYGTVARDSGLNLSVKSIAQTDLTAPQKSILGSVEADLRFFEYQVNGGGCDDLGGVATITMPYILGSYEDPGKISVYYMDSRGNLERFPCTYADGFVTFETTHFSLYFATTADLTGGQAEADKPGDEGNTMLYVGIAVVVLIVAVLAVFLMRGRSEAR